MVYFQRCAIFLIINTIGIIKMRKVALLTCLSLMSLSAMAEVLTCDALRTRVDEKLQAKKVPSYTLEIIPSERTNNSAEAASSVIPSKVIKGKEVGTCDGGTKRLIYTRGN